MMDKKYYTGSKEGFVVYEYNGTMCLARCGTPSVKMMDEFCERNGDIIRKRIWFRDVADENRHYLDTGIDGSYETVGLHDSTVTDREIALFDDTLIHEQPDGLSLERRMSVEGKRFAVQSVFGNGGATPIDKLLTVIDNEQNNV